MDSLSQHLNLSTSSKNCEKLAFAFIKQPLTKGGKQDLWNPKKYANFFFGALVLVES